ncbi:tRNA 2'-phosphotransferase [Coemansia aciculifera]|uniref:2'-phosphotransferase n=1 Tax=Coemansia aciculifera TaxID=417176 RepID=A0A9W8IJP6_9FUNG|nr:tRNA 2'-phosphotransferase [Coemansia aciculifera]KAJ2874246.1 tRNA 2'-phosphotransferase [Coemansia aciculifera]
MSSSNQTNTTSDIKRGDTGRPRGKNVNDTPEVRLSKLLSYLLRHGAEDKGLKLRDDGSISISDLLRYQKLKSTTFAQIQQVVETNNKKRFTLYEENEQWYIRAVQGHSIKIKEPPLVKFTKETMPSCIVHGTMRSKMPLIQETGLNRMTRTHIHFAKGLPSDAGIISGMRNTADAYIYIDIARAVSDGIEFYESENGVTLSKGLNDSGIIPAKYFERIEYKNSQ